MIKTQIVLLIIILNTVWYKANNNNDYYEFTRPPRFKALFVYCFYLQPVK